MAENTWNPETRQPETRIRFNLGRVDTEARNRPRRLAQRIVRWATPEGAAAAPDVALERAWPYGDLYVLDALREEGPTETSLASSRFNRSPLVP